jgi:hypothetical protein
MAAARPTRRIFQFSITSMLLVTALVAIWLAWELAFIRERQAWIKDHPLLVDPSLFQGLPAHVATIPWWRRVLGDEAVPSIAALDIWDDDDKAAVTRLFPEAALRDVANSANAANAAFTDAELGLLIRGTQPATPSSVVDGFRITPIESATTGRVPE